MVTSEVDDFPCSYHPNVRTRLRCSKCGKPICPRCAVETPVGFRCPDCAQVRGLPTYQAGPTTLLKAGIVGLLVAVGCGVLWGYYPSWVFYICLLLGFGVAEGINWAANHKRGGELQFLGVVCVIIGIVIARVIMSRQAGQDLSYVLNHPDVFSWTDILFMVMALAIPFVRFR